ncbi:MAG: NDP-sugar synthase [Dehalococcoidia bacterium]
MRALILAGGRATRLRPLTETTPKAMTPLLGRPFLEHVLAWLLRHGIDEITLLLGHLAEPIRAHFGDGHAFGVRLGYVIEETALGSGGAIKQLEAELREPFFALNGDIFTDLDLGAMVAAHRQAGAALTISLEPVNDPSSYGVVARDDDGWATRFVEKPPAGAAPSNLINAGTWLFEPETLRRIAADTYTMVERDLFPALAAERRLLGFAPSCYWMDAGTAERYLQLHRDLLAGRAGGALALVERSGWPGLFVQTAPGAPRRLAPAPVVDPSGSLEGAVVLDAGVRIGAGAAVRGPACLGADVVVQDGARIEDSVIWSGCRVGPNAVVAASILAAGCVVGGGARLTGAVLGEGTVVPSGATVP